MTVTPNGAVSAASTRLKPSTANFAAWQLAMPGDPPTGPARGGGGRTRGGAEAGGGGGDEADLRHTFSTTLFRYFRNSVALHWPGGDVRISPRAVGRVPARAVGRVPARAVGRVPARAVGQGQAAA